MSATKTFQAWLIKARTKGGFSYGQLAIKSGVSGATIHGLEHSDTSPSLDTVEKLCTALGTSVESALRVRVAKPKLGPFKHDEPDEPAVKDDSML